MVTTDHQVAATHLSGAWIAGSLVAFAWKATGILHDARAHDGQAGRHAAGAASGSPAPAKGVASVVTRFVAWIAAAIADEIGRDLRDHGPIRKHHTWSVPMSHAGPSKPATLRSSMFAPGRRSPG